MNQNPVGSGAKNPFETGFFWVDFSSQYDVEYGRELFAVKRSIAVKDNSDSQFFYKILNGINSNNRIIDVDAKRDETKVLKPKSSLAY